MELNSTVQPIEFYEHKQFINETWVDVNDSVEIYKNYTFTEEEIYLEFQIVLRKYVYDLYTKQKQELYDMPWTLVIVLSLLYGTLSLISSFGNGLVIWVVLVSQQMRTVTNLYIVNLAFADMIIGIFVIPFQFQAALLQRWYLPEFLCAFCPFVQALSVNLSVFTLSAISVDRHQAVIHPLHAWTSKKQAIGVIICIWLIAIATSLPTWFDYKVITVKKILMPAHPFCRNVGLPRNIRRMYNIGLVITQYVFPLIVITFAYTRMGIRLWGRTAPGNKEKLRDALLLRSKQKIIKMLTLVVLLFCVCWLPLQIYNFVQYTYPKINNYKYINVVWFCIHWLAMSNSCVNPFIYAIYNDKFQSEFAARLGCLMRMCHIIKRSRNVQARSCNFGEIETSISENTMTIMQTCSRVKRSTKARSFIEAESSKSGDFSVCMTTNTRKDCIRNKRTRFADPDVIDDKVSLSENSAKETEITASFMRCSKPNSQCSPVNKSEMRCDIIPGKQQETGVTTTITVLVTNHLEML